MSKLNDFLTEAGIFFVATNDGAQPKLRPFGAHVEVDGKEIFAVGDFKAVYRQMLANPLCEIVACKPDGVWLRYTGRIVFDDDPKYQEAMFASSPLLKEIYNEKTGFKMKTFHLEDATAFIMPPMGEPEKIL
ncbi:MAG: pyridoxamine 5'-phosphate oxidase family protein [Ruminococcus sp.]|uniref:pyridoxamine 5'-phosphate oxidase family protein n=1 Tax=Ruminococcus sp. TaxID=41978 RepID=UPI0025D57621|nr:pyridoxamine 5'-phosphate oxidase family protein [Ruminococcus sp.]MBR5683560.1 pyridoxamine 5'-phosphate oxidase family protein [Ruminococcus sp.]